MKEYLDKNTLFNTVAMFLQSNDDIVLVLEGADDHLLLERFATAKLKLLEATGGREQVLGAARLAQNRGLKRARFLVDRDYDRFTGATSTQLNNVFVSDQHDCFTDLLVVDSGLLQRVIDVYTASARRRIGNPRGVPDTEALEEQAVELASKLSAVRIVSARRGLGFDFRRFSFGALKIVEFELNAIVRLNLTRSQYVGDDQEDIFAEVESVHAEILELEHIPVGDHDLFGALARVLRRYDVKVSVNSLQQGYILAATYFAVSGTGWFREIQDWCRGFGIQGFADPNDLKLVG